MEVGRSPPGWDSPLLYGSVFGSWGEWLLNAPWEDSECQTPQRRWSLLTGAFLVALVKRVASGPSQEK